MKKINLATCCLLACFLLLFKNTSAQKPVNWTTKDLIKPSDLANTLKANVNLPLLFSIGPGAVIPHSIDIGMINDDKNMANFKEQISKLPKSTNIVVYCGCCPYEHCPNVRPAMAVLQSLKFTNYHLLDLPTNIKTDWIAKGYPVKQ
ncbi:MAG: rhodanese-like protein [Chitinophagaceae bacterium]|nr:rhodanese-like protein [Chitinophagaceae bacterium]